MRTTIDKAGRLVVPKVLRDQAGISCGEVEVVLDGAALRIEAIAGDDVESEDDRLVIPASGGTLDDDAVKALRDASRR